MKKPKIVHQPYYAGGTKAMTAYLQEHLTYPAEALEARVEGSVHLRYDINHRGQVVGTEVLNGIGYGCDEEAERLVRGMQFVIPQKARGLRIRYHKTLKVNFHLPPVVEEKVAEPAVTNLVYSTSSTGTGGKSYSYRIDLPEGS